PAKPDRTDQPRPQGGPRQRGRALLDGALLDEERRTGAEVELAVWRSEGDVRARIEPVDSRGRIEIGDALAVPGEVVSGEQRPAMARRVGAADAKEQGGRMLAAGLTERNRARLDRDGLAPRERGRRLPLESADRCIGLHDARERANQDEQK